MDKRYINAVFNFNLTSGCYFMSTTYSSYPHCFVRNLRIGLLSCASQIRIFYMEKSSIPWLDYSFIHCSCQTKWVKCLLLTMATTSGFISSIIGPKMTLGNVSSHQFKTEIEPCYRICLGRAIHYRSL